MPKEEKQIETSSALVLKSETHKSKNNVINKSEKKERMGQMTNNKAKKEVKEEIKKEEENEEEGEEEQQEEQDGVSVHSPCKINSSSLRKEKPEVELELRLLEALEIYPPSKLRGVHRHFVLYGLTEYMRRSFNRPFTADDVLKLLERFFNLEMVKPDDEDAELLSNEEDFRLPQSFFADEEKN